MDIGCDGAVYGLPVVVVVVIRREATFAVTKPIQAFVSRRTGNQCYGV